MHCLKIVISTDSCCLESPELWLQELPLISREGDTFGSRLDGPCLLVLSGKSICHMMWNKMTSLEEPAQLFYIPVLATS